MVNRILGSTMTQPYHRRSLKIEADRVLARYGKDANNTCNRCNRILELKTSFLYPRRPAPTYAQGAQVGSNTMRQQGANIHADSLYANASALSCGNAVIPAHAHRRVRMHCQRICSTPVRGRVAPNDRLGPQLSRDFAGSVHMFQGAIPSRVFHW
jgi:hypothetical protein